MYCTRCGKEIKENAEFCTRCGAKTSNSRGEKISIAANVSQAVTNDASSQMNEENTVNAPSVFQIAKEKGYKLNRFYFIIVQLVLQILFSLIDGVMVIDGIANRETVLAVLSGLLNFAMSVFGVYVIYEFVTFKSGTIIRYMLYVVIYIIVGLFTATALGVGVSGVAVLCMITNISYIKKLKPLFVNKRGCSQLTEEELKKQEEKLKSKYEKIADTEKLWRCSSCGEYNPVSKSICKSCGYFRT